MSHTSIVRRKQDSNKQDWEANDFPIVCESCLGDNPYIRMTKETFGKECKMCTRPFTVFRWRPGARGRYKKTEICNVCAKLKNICQGCILDLQFGLPSQILDQALPNSVKMPESEANKEYFMDQAEKMIELAQRERETTTPDQMLSHLNQSSPYYQKSQQPICTLFKQGKCVRGKDCPYRHDEADQSGNVLQSIRGKYSTSNPAKQILSRLINQLQPPEDTSITTLYVGGVRAPVSEKDLRETFDKFGELLSVVVVSKLQSAFVKFEKREDAEKAANDLYKKLVVKNIPLSLKWGNADSTMPALPIGQRSVVAPLPPGMPALGPSPIASMFPSGQYYPSTDPSAYGTVGDNQPAASPFKK